MYQTAFGKVTDAQASEIEALNNKIWQDFWKIPKEKRTFEDWERLFEIQIIVKND